MMIDHAVMWWCIGGGCALVFGLPTLIVACWLWWTR